MRPQFRKDSCGERVGWHPGQEHGKPKDKHRPILRLQRSRGSFLHCNAGVEFLRFPRLDRTVVRWRLAHLNDEVKRGIEFGKSRSRSRGISTHLCIGIAVLAKTWRAHMQDQIDNQTHVDDTGVPQATPVQPAEKFDHTVTHLSRTSKKGRPLTL